MFSTCSQSSIFQIHLCYFTLCQFFCQFTLILLYINGVCPFAFCGLVLASRGLFIPLASWWACFLAADTSFPRLLTNFSSNLLAPLHRVCCPNILLADRRGAGFGTFKTQNRGDHPPSPPPPTKKSPYGLFFANSFYIRRS